MIKEVHFSVKQLWSQVFNSAKNRMKAEEDRLYKKYRMSVLPMIAQHEMWKEVAKNMNPDTYGPCRRCKFGRNTDIHEACFFGHICCSRGGWLAGREDLPEYYDNIPVTTPESIIEQHLVDESITPFYDYRIMVVYDK